MKVFGGGLTMLKDWRIVGLQKGCIGSVNDCSQKRGVEYVASKEVGV